MKIVISAVVVMLAGCASMDYKPVQERSFAQLVSGRCSESGEQMLVTAHVNKAYQNTVVLWDGIDPQATVAVTLPRSTTQRVRGWFGKNRQEVSEQKLNDLAARGVPVTVGLLCQGGSVAPEAQSLAYTDAEGQRVAIAY